LPGVGEATRVVVETGNAYTVFDAAGHHARPAAGTDPPDARCD
jgi:hypothetical protein